MKISYAITVCNEFVEIQNLINFLLKHKRTEDEIIVLYDFKNGDEGVEEFLRISFVIDYRILLFSWKVFWNNNLTSINNFKFK